MGKTDDGLVGIGGKWGIGKRKLIWCKWRPFIFKGQCIMCLMSHLCGT